MSTVDTGCPRCKLGDYGTERRADGVRHKATERMPDFDTLMEWEADGGCEATDGCWIEADGRCEHGHSSWLLRLGMI